MRIAPTRRRRPVAEPLEARELLTLTLSPIVDYPVPTRSAAPVDVALGSDGAIWITESGANQIGRYDPTTRSFAGYNVPTVGSTPYRIIPDPSDGNLYFTERTGGNLGRITTAGVISETPVVNANNQPVTGATPIGLAYDPLGYAMYATRLDDQRVGLFQVGDDFQYLPYMPGQARPTAGAPNSGNWGIAFDGSLQTTAIYFTERDADKIGVFEIDPNTGTFATHEYALASGSRPLDIVQGPDGGFWFVESGTGKIGRIDPTTRAITEYATPTASSGPWGITSGNGRLYFTESTANKIGRIAFDSHGNPVIAEFPLPSGGTPRGITVGNDGQVWFAEETSNRLGLFYGDATNLPPDVFSAAVPLPSGNYQALGLAAAPDGKLYAYIDRINSSVSVPDGVAEIDPLALRAQEFPVNEGTYIGLGGQGGGWMAVDNSGALYLGNPSIGTLVFQVSPQFGVFSMIPLVAPASATGRSSSSDNFLYGPYLSSSDNNTYAGFAGFHEYNNGIANIPLSFAAFGGVASDASGDIWTLGLQGLTSVVARIDPDTGQATTFPVKGGTGLILLGSDTVAIGPDGNVWFTFNADAAIGKLVPSTGQVTLYPTGDPPDFPGIALLSLVSAPDGRLWFLDAEQDALIAVDPSTGAMTPYPVPVPIAPATGILPINSLAVGPDGNLWISSGDPNNPGVLQFKLGKASASPPPTVGAYLATVYGQLAGLTLSAPRERAILAGALGPRPGVSAATALGAIPEARRAKILDRLASAVQRTPEYRRAGLQRLAYATLHGPADVKLLRTRAPIPEVRLSVLGSTAYLKARGDGRPQGFVAALYRDLLGRAPTSAESRHWVGVLASGADRRSVASALASSRQALTRSVGRTYREVLGRDATPGELASGVRLLRRRGGADRLVLSLVTSAEYAARKL